MKIEEMSEEALLDKLMFNGGFKYKAELLRRFREKDEEIKKLKDTIVYHFPYDEALCLLNWKQRAETAEARLKELEATTEVKGNDL